MRTRQAAPGSPLSDATDRHVRRRRCRRHAAPSKSRKGFARGGVLFQAHVRNAEDYDGPETEVFNSGWEDQGFLVNAQHSLGRGLLSRRLAE